MRNTSTCAKKIKNSCSNIKLGKDFRSLKRLINCFINYDRARLIEELIFYKKQPSFKKLIEDAALSKKENGKRHDHQWRIKKEVLKQAKDKLINIEKKLLSCLSFDELYKLVERQIKEIPGIGDLTIYDITQRIGCFNKLRLKPEKVYLHCGTQKGAKTLKLNTEGGTLSKEAFPKELQQLSCAEIEDFLCIYKDFLK